MTFMRCAGAFMVLAVSLIAVRADEPDTYSSVQDLEKARKAKQVTTQNLAQNLWWEHLIPGRIEEKQRLAEEAKANASKEKSGTGEKVVVKTKASEANSRQAELNKALRREAVCQRLRDIAEETNDPELAKQADLLESRAWAVYEQKMSSASLARFQPMNDKDVETRLLQKRSDTTESAQAETSSGVRSIRGEKKE
ncbi:MAG: hypothetical protein QM703_01960 [Gemmatales bacterium]